MARSALEDVSEAIYGALNVSTLTTIATSGVYSHVPQDTDPPYVWYTVDERDVDGTFGAVMKDCTVRVHAFSIYQGDQEVQQMINASVSLLRGTTPALDHHTALLLVHDGSTPATDENVGGVQTKHAVADFRVTVIED